MSGDSFSLSMLRQSIDQASSVNIAADFYRHRVLYLMRRRASDVSVLVISCLFTYSRWGRRAMYEEYRHVLYSIHFDYFYLVLRLFSARSMSSKSNIKVIRLKSSYFMEQNKFWGDFAPIMKCNKFYRGLAISKYCHNTHDAARMRRPLVMMPTINNVTPIYIIYLITYRAIYECTSYVPRFKYHFAAEMAARHDARLIVIASFTQPLALSFREISTHRDKPTISKSC